MKTKLIGGYALGVVLALVAVLIAQTVYVTGSVAAPVSNAMMAQGVDQGLAEAKKEAEAEAARIAREKAKAEKAARIAREKAAREEAARRAAANSSLTGIQASAYTGPYFNSGHESTRMCIVGKESGGNYRVVSSNGLWHGAYQFTIGTSNNAAKMMGRSDLVGTPASQWNRAEQDQAFWTTWNHGAGRGNWPTAYGC